MCRSLPPFTFRGSVSRTLRRARRGFTLLEILVVLAIIGLLAGLAITNVDRIFGGAQVETTRLFVTQGAKTALTSYMIHMGTYPSTSEGLQALVSAPASRADRWHGPYLAEQKVPVDHWGEPYQYEFPGKRNKNSYDLWSKGPDRVSGSADDIGNWDSGPSEK